MFRNHVIEIPRRHSLPACLLAASLLGLSACNSKSNPAAAPVPHPANPDRTIGSYDALPGLVLAITSVGGGTGAGGNLRVGDKPVVRYTAATSGGAPIDVASLDGGSIYVSGPTFDYQRVIVEQTDLRSRSVYLGEGAWSYTFAVPIPATYLAPLNDTASFTAGELTGQALLSGTYTVGMLFDATYMDANEAEFVDAGNAAGDFLFGDSDTITARAVVQSDNCNVCHTGLRVHDGKLRDVRMCVLCHTAGAEDSNDAGATPGVTIEFKVMMHRLHNGSHLPAVLGVSTNTLGVRVYPGQVGAITPQSVQFADADGVIHDYSAATFPVWPNLNVAMPRDFGYSSLSSTDPDGTGPLRSPRGCEDTIRTGATACAKCHGDPDADGPLGPPAQGELAYVQPSRRVCGSCHDDVDWNKPYAANGLTMVEQLDDSACKECHTPTAATQASNSLKPLSVTEAHSHPLVDAAVDPGVDTTISAVTGGTMPSGNHQAGDPVAVTFTIENDAGTDLGLSSMDACSAFFMGPTTNQQLIMPFTSPNSMAINPFDFSGRLHAVSTSNKGTMSKMFVGSTAVAETLTVEFSSATTFAVTGSASGALGAGALPASPSTNPSGSSLSAIELGSSLNTGTIQVTFTSATHFDITGAVTGSGDLPASTSASTRFSSANLSFNISVGTTPFAANNTIQIALFRGNATNPVLFAIVGGRTAFAATDRFYFEVVPNALTYTANIPMDLVFEFLGDSTAAAGQVLPATGNLPVYYGRQQLWEVATTATTTTTTANVAALGRKVAVASSTGWANGDLVVVDPAAGVGTREYVQIAPEKADGVIAASGDTTVALNFKTPLRYAHSSAVTITKVTQAFKQEGATNAYTLNPTTGVVTSTGAFTAARALVMSYRSHARFGWRRHSGDTLQASYVPPANDSTDIGQEQGDWQGLPYQDGTYSADLWFAKNIDHGVQNELQTYRSTSDSSSKDFLFGSATTIVPHAIISTSANCYTCHNDVIFHGGGRRGVDACLTCHSISGNEDKPRWDTPIVSGAGTPTLLTTGVAIEFRQMLHKIHKGADLANALTYTVTGNGGTPHTYEAVEFPAMPGGVRQCARCHGNDAWKEPGARAHTSATSPIKTWGSVCGSCHDSTSAQAHITANTTGFNYESCSVCHGQGREFAVEKVHLNR